MNVERNVHMEKDIRIAHFKYDVNLYLASLVIWEYGIFYYGRVRSRHHNLYTSSILEIDIPNILGTLMVIGKFPKPFREINKYYE